MLNGSVEKIKGIGAKRAEALGRLGIRTAEELLRFLPRDYQDFSFATPVSALKHGQLAAVRARAADAPRTAYFHGMRVLSAKAFDETGAVTVKWYNQPYRARQLRLGETQVFCGRVDARKGLALVNPSIQEEPPGILPVYSLVSGLTQAAMRASVRAALAALPPELPDSLPAWLCGLYGLRPLSEALREAHFPESKDSLKAALRRLSFESALLYLLAVESAKSERRRQNGIAFDCAGAYEALCPRFPFVPTGAQKRAMREIAQDMSRSVPMNRLLQGDVGAGKTAVALYAMSIAVRNGYQAVLMAPTEILAEQHYGELSRLFGPEACLLSGGMRKAARDAAGSRIASGEAKYVVGTHALLESGVRFARLGLVITDEQHRFGVAQRAILQDKGVRPDVLVMSATPIPRTLALLLFGDLDVSVLDELPPGRLPVVTRYIQPGKRGDMYRYLAKCAAEGRQSYIVCPLIEESGEVEAESVTALFERLKSELPGAPLGLLHGKMRPAEKQRAIEDFRAGRTGLLVTTTVIEVGVHVPSATVMVVESAERFGLSQLHQLRGRVGRGREQAYCFLLSDHPGEDAMARIETMVRERDGFAIAEQDLAQRGAGDFLGMRQHGEGMALRVGGALDLERLKQAREAAGEIMALPTVQNNALLDRAKETYLAAGARIAMN